MKKSLLTTVLGLAFGATFAQTPFVLYKGDKKTDFLNGDFYSFDPPSPKVVDSLFLGSTDKSLYFSGSTTGYFIGGFGNSGYSGATKLKIASAFDGKVATSTFGFTAYTQGTDAVLKVQLKSATSTFGYVFDLTSAKTGPAPFSVTLGTFKTVVKDEPTGTPITDADFETIDEVQFVVNYKTAVGEATVILDNIVLVDGTLTGLSNDFIVESKDEVLIAYDVTGKIVGKGKASELFLEAGKLYILKSATKSRKVIIAQ